MASLFEQAHDLAANLHRSPERIELQRKFAASLLPPEILDKPEIEPLVTATLQLAASSLAAVEIQYGYDALQPKMIHGAAEQGVLAAYHNGTHTRRMMMTDSLAYARMCRIYDGPQAYSDEDLVLQIFASSVHDIIQGDGRGEDERQSAELAVRLMESNGYRFSGGHKDQVYYGVYATKFDPVTKKQSVDARKPHLKMQKAIAIGDLLTLCRPDGPLYTIALSVEEFSLSSSRYGQVLVKEADKSGFALQDSNLPGCLEFYGRNPVLKEAFGDYLRAQSAFYRDHRYPDERIDSWFPGREANAAFLDHLSALYDAGRLTPVGVHSMILERTTVLAVPA